MSITAGPNGTSSGVSTSGTGSAWTNPGNITAADMTYATAALLLMTSQYLAATGFGFSVPAGATIDGIVVEWLRVASGTITDTASRIVQGGTIGTTDRSVGGNWSSTPGYQSYGGPSDLWGLTWAPADINASGFGAALVASGPSAGGTAYVDHCRITVYYTAGGGAALDEDGVTFQTRTIW